MQIGNIKLPYVYEMKDSTSQNISLPKVDSEKDLGITFQDNLKFDQHVLNTMYRKPCKQINRFNKEKWC
jgi:hypothetical protein